MFSTNKFSSENDIGTQVSGNQKNRFDLFQFIKDLEIFPNENSFPGLKKIYEFTRMEK